MSFRDAVVTSCMSLACLILASCRTSGTKVLFAAPIEVPEGRIVGYIDPSHVYQSHPQPTTIDLYFQLTASTRTKRIRLTTTQSKHGLSLVSVGHHSYTVPMEIGGGPPPPGPFQGGVGVITHDVVVDVRDRQPRYLVLRDRGPMWAASLPPPFYYGFSDRPDLQYKILPGSQIAPKPTKKL